MQFSFVSNGHLSINRKLIHHTEISIIIHKSPIELLNKNLFLISLIINLLPLTCAVPFSISPQFFLGAFENHKVSSDNVIGFWLYVALMALGWNNHNSHP
jgi:hypothetical protein